MNSVFISDILLSNLAVFSNIFCESGWDTSSFLSDFFTGNKISNLFPILSIFFSNPKLNSVFISDELLSNLTVFSNIFCESSVLDKSSTLTSDVVSSTLTFGNSSSTLIFDVVSSTLIFGCCSSTFIFDVVSSTLTFGCCCCSLSSSSILISLSFNISYIDCFNSSVLISDTSEFEFNDSDSGSLFIAIFICSWIIGCVFVFWFVEILDSNCCLIIFKLFWILLKFSSNVSFIDLSKLYSVVICNNFKLWEIKLKCFNISGLISDSLGVICVSVCVFVSISIGVSFCVLFFFIFDTQ